MQEQHIRWRTKTYHVDNHDGREDADNHIETRFKPFMSLVVDNLIGDAQDRHGPHECDRKMSRYGLGWPEKKPTTIDTKISNQLVTELLPWCVAGADKDVDDRPIYSMQHVSHG